MSEVYIYIYIFFKEPLTTQGCKVYVFVISVDYVKEL